MYSPQKLEEDRESGRGVSLPQSPVTVQMESLDVNGAEAFDAAQKIAYESFDIHFSSLQIWDARAFGSAKYR